MSLSLTADEQTRRAAMGLLARARPDHLARLFPDLPSHAPLRGPETGAVMVRGRVGGTGQPFNLAEMSVTRCSVRLEAGEVGHAHVQGRDKDHARRAAVIDALLQTAAAPGLRARVLQPLAEAEDAARAARAARAAATRVEFFTLVRGED
jgi:alpha-D-ribose 1-methylphosphonate 5-triphosphate synthase subunit PhnG